MALAGLYLHGLITLLELGRVSLTLSQLLGCRTSSVSTTDK